MSVVDLCKRATANWDLFCKFVRSSDSLIYFENEVPTISDPPGSIDLTVGDQWHDPAEGKDFAIDASGLLVKPHSCVVVEVAQRIVLPHNVMALVTGKGKFIFQAAMISTGKVDPGFNKRLRIGFLNAGSQAIVLHRNMPFCSCCFFNTETEAKNPKHYEFERTLAPAPIPRLLVIGRWWKDNWKSFVPIVVSLASLAVAIATLVWRFKKV